MFGRSSQIRPYQLAQLPLKSYKPFTLTKNCYHWWPCLRCFPGDRFDVPGVYAIETNLPIRDRVLFHAGGLRNASSKCEQESGSAEKRSTSPGSQSANLTSIQQHARQAENGDPFRSCDWHGYPQAAGTGSERILHSQSSPRQFCCL